MTMKRTSKVALLVWPVCGVLAACDADQKLGTAAGDSGAGGEAQASGGDADWGTAGSSTHSAGGQRNATAGASSGADVGRAGQNTGGRVNGTGGRAEATGGGAGGTDRGQAGQGTGGTIEASGGAGTGDTGGRHATGGRAGQGAGGSAPSEGLPGASSFSKITIRASGGMGMYYPTSPEDECSMSDEALRLVDSASQTLSWDFCGYGPPSEIQRGTRTLSDAEFQVVLNTLSLVAPSTGYSCGNDAPVMTLELEVDGSSTLYTDDFYKCDNDPNSKNYVQGLDSLLDWVYRLSNGLEIPATPSSLDVYTDELLDQDPPQDSVCWDHLVPHYGLDVSTGNLGWDYCTTPAESGAFSVVTGSRMLEETELATVLRAYGDLELGASGPCGSLSVPSSDYVPSVQIDGRVSLMDEGGSCAAQWSGREYAIGVPALVRVIVGLVQ